MHELNNGWTTIETGTLVPYNEKTMGDPVEVPVEKAKTGVFWIIIIVLVVVILVLVGLLIKTKMDSKKEEPSEKQESSTKIVFLNSCSMILGIEKVDW